MVIEQLRRKWELHTAAFRATYGVKRSVAIAIDTFAFLACLWLFTVSTNLSHTVLVVLVGVGSLMDLIWKVAQ